MAVSIENANGQSPILLVCEHASHALPPKFGSLGLDIKALTSHIAWDPGAMGVALGLAKALDAVLVAGTISRLIYDCNRPPSSPTAIPQQSELYIIPGNRDLSPANRQWRISQVYERFHQALRKELDRRATPAIIVTLHSFTPIFHGQVREVELGILDGGDRRLPQALIEHLTDSPFIVRANEPYGPQDGVAYTLQEHGIKRGLLNVMLEIRNDLIREEADQEAMADQLARPILDAVAAVAV